MKYMNPSRISTEMLWDKMCVFKLLNVEGKKS